MINLSKFKPDNFSKNEILLTIFTSILVFVFFNYELSSGGGFYYYLSFVLFDSNLLVILFPIAFLICNHFLEFHKVKNLILIIVLILLEIDGQFYIETYDPLLFVLIFSLFNINLVNKFFNSNLNKNTFILFGFMISVLFLKIFQNFSNINIWWIKKKWFFSRRYWCVAFANTSCAIWHYFWCYWNRTWFWTLLNLCNVYNNI